jgi:hypothetical protein
MDERSNPNRRGVKPATNRLSYGTAVSGSHCPTIATDTEEITGFKKVFYNMHFLFIKDDS